MYCVARAFDTINSALDTPLAKMMGAVLIAYFVYRLGRKAYFDEKETELGRDRYLEKGIDLVAAQVDYALGVNRHNWMLFLRFLKLYRDSPVAIELDDYFQQFRELDHSHFQVAPAHRLHSLIGDEIIWTVYQRVFAFVGTRNDALKADLGEALKLIAPDVPVHKDLDFIRRAEEAAEKMNRDANRFYVFLSRLMELAAIVERSRLTVSELQKIRHRKDVVEIVAALRELFPETPTDVSLTDRPTSGGDA